MSRFFRIEYIERAGDPRIDVWMNENVHDDYQIIHIDRIEASKPISQAREDELRAAGHRTYSNGREFVMIWTIILTPAPT